MEKAPPIVLPIQTFYNNIVLGLLRMVIEKDPNAGIGIRRTLKDQMPIIYRSHFEREISTHNLSDDERKLYEIEFEKALEIVMLEINSILDKLSVSNKLSANKGESNG